MFEYFVKFVYLSSGYTRNRSPWLLFFLGGGGNTPHFSAKCRGMIIFNTLDMCVFSGNSTWLAEGQCSVLPINVCIQYFKTYRVSFHRTRCKDLCTWYVHQLYHKIILFELLIKFKNKKYLFPIGLHFQITSFHVVNIPKNHKSHVTLFSTEIIHW